MEWKAIGRVVSAAQDARDDGWGAVVSEIRLDTEFARGLEGLAGFSHAIVLFHMHQAPFDPSLHVRVKGLDAIDGSPVLDIKPYFPAFDRPAETREPSWVEPFMQGYF